jgi:excisionase family DNA binding protein
MDNHSLNPILVGIPEAARLMGLGRSKLYQILNEGELNLIKLGGRSLVSVDELRSYVAEKLAKAADRGGKNGGAA